MMPWGFSVDDVKFTTDTLDQFPGHAAAIGKIVTSFSLIEGFSGAIYGFLKNTTIDDALDELSKYKTNHARIQAIIKLINSKTGTVHAAQTLIVLDRVLKHAEQRNKVAHGMWGSVDGDTDNLRHIQVKKAIPFFAAIVANGSAGSPLAGLKEFVSSITTYSLADLEMLEKAGETLLVEVFGCYNAIGKAAAIADGWTQTTDPKTGKPMLKTPPTP